MGNCLATRVVSNHAQSSLKHPSPEKSKNYDSNEQLHTNYNKQPNEVSASRSNGQYRGNDDHAETSSNNNISRSNDNKNIGYNNTVGKIVTPNLKKFTLSDLKRATRNFRPHSMLGEGGFGRVFKGWVDENYAPSRVGVGMAVAVKKSNPDSSQGLREWQAEVRFLGKFSHPNLVRLLGYCCEEGQFLLVYEYMPKGSLENHLFRNAAEPLSWDIRINIAIGAAQGLAFLHTSEKSVIYRDFKPSNILLDSEYNAKLSDFGLAKLGPINGNSHITTQVFGTYGYAAPEYVATGHLYVKSDVYGFGVVLLEMLTGLKALDTTRPLGLNKLVDWAKPSLSEKRKLRKIMDQRLEGRYPINGAIQVGELIVQCLESDPRDRPSIEQVLDTLIEVKAVKEKPNGRMAIGKKHGNKSPLMKEC